MNIKEPAPNLVTQEALIADKIASIAVPSAGQSVWDNYLPVATGQIQPPGSGGLAARVPTPDTTSKFKALQNQLGGYETRDEFANRAGVRLPNLMGKPTRGIATATNVKNIEEEHYGNGWQAQVDGGTGAAAKAGDTQFVDDKGWPVTLKGLLGSRLLSSDMLQKASIQNVRKFMNISGGTTEQRQELEYMMQRAMLEGFIRGVDITKDLKAGGIKMNIKDISGNIIGRRYNTTSNGATADGVDFDSNFWNRKAEADQYTLFLHEVVGHALLNVDANHNRGTSVKISQNERVMTPIYQDSVLANYDKMMDGLFNETSIPSKSKFSVKDFGAAAVYDKSWFPAITGVEETAGGIPGTTTGGADTDNRIGAGEPDQYNITPHSIGRGSDTQGTIQVGGVNSGGAISGQPQVGGALSSDIQTSTKTFAAGMADLSQRNTGADMSQAGQLLKSG